MENVDIHYVGTWPLSDTVKAQPSSLSPELRKPCRAPLGELPGVEGLPRAAGSDFRAASSCLLLLPSVGDSPVLPGLPRLIFRLWECLMK